MDNKNTEMVEKARAWSRQNVQALPWIAHDEMQALAAALEAAEAEKARRDTVIAGLREMWDREINLGFQFLYRPSIVPELRALLDSVPDERRPCDDEELAAAPVSLEAVKAEAWDEGNEACRAVYVEGRKSGPVVNPYRKLEEANRG